MQNGGFSNEEVKEFQVMFDSLLANCAILNSTTDRSRDHQGR